MFPATQMQILAVQTSGEIRDKAPLTKTAELLTKVFSIAGCDRIEGTICRETFCRVFYGKCLQLLRG